MNATFTTYIARLTLLAAMLAGALGVSAAPTVKTIKGKATYYAEPNESPLEAQQKAREAAIYNGILETFGSVMNQTYIQEDMLNETGETTRLYSNSAFELKGEWIADLKKEYVPYMDKKGNYVVEYEIEFRAREITNQAPPIDCATLITPDFRSKGTDFHDGDNLYVSFCSPTTDGYLTIAMTDETGQVYRLLPGQSSTSQAMTVNKGYDYIFFDQKRQSPDGSKADRMVVSVTPGRKMEFNTIYFIFSPNAYNAGPWQRGAGRRMPPHMAMGEFNSWLQTMAMRDPQMTWRAVRVAIRPGASKGELIKLD